MLVAARDHLGVAPLFNTRGRDEDWTIGTTVGEILDQQPQTRTRLDEDSVVAHVAGPAAPDPDTHLLFADHSHTSWDADVVHA